MFYKVVFQHPTEGTEPNEAKRHEMAKVLNRFMILGHVYHATQHPIVKFGGTSEKVIYTVKEIAECYPFCFAAVTPEEMVDVFNSSVEIDKTLTKLEKQVLEMEEKVKALEHYNAQE